VTQLHRHGLRVNAAGHALSVGHGEPHGDGRLAASPERGEAFGCQVDIQAGVSVVVQHDEAEAVAGRDLAHDNTMPYVPVGVKLS
jgi:hypothetical protein